MIRLDSWFRTSDGNQPRRKSTQASKNDRKNRMSDLLASVSRWHDGSDIVPSLKATHRVSLQASAGNARVIVGTFENTRIWLWQMVDNPGRGQVGTNLGAEPWVKGQHKIAPTTDCHCDEATAVRTARQQDFQTCEAHNRKCDGK